ncbi:MAG: GNAT family N-acetyltransferase [Clostridiales bacterium]|nr:GNAT family N-acetyltransferase [Clostridiales bacterium]
MNGGALRTATDDEAVRLWPVVRRALLFDSAEEYERFRKQGPWRIQISQNGTEAAIVERWRDHLDILAVKGLYCAEERIGALIDSLASVAGAQEFGLLLSPLVCADTACRYEAAGMRVHTEMVVLRAAREPKRVQPPPGVIIRPAVPGDLGALVTLDAACFDEFWRYDANRLTRHLEEDRLSVADEAGRVIGYTLATVVRDSPTIGRLAVSPATRRRGVGEALLSEALRYLGRTCSGTVSLCTQQANMASRRLYAKAGMRELATRLVFLVRDVREG